MFADTHRYSLMGYWNDCKGKNDAKKYRMTAGKYTFPAGTVG
jgi:hypothetical protein